MSAEPELNKLSARVLDCVDLIPRGFVATYGDIAELVGTGPRQVAKVMSTYGQLTNWWRVVRADGGSQVADSAREHWDLEGISYSQATQLRVKMEKHRVGMETMVSFVEKQKDDLL